MNISDIKELMSQFDVSSLRDFAYKKGSEELSFSKNEAVFQPVPSFNAPQQQSPQISEPVIETDEQDYQDTVQEVSTPAPEEHPQSTVAEGEEVLSPLVGVAYLAAAPDKPNFVSVGDTVTQGQTLLIIEAMKVMNEIPAPKDGVVTEILVANEDVIEYGQGLVRIK